MENNDFNFRRDKVLDEISDEDLCRFARQYALCNDDMALALIERFWQPDAADYKQVVDACFVHPFVISVGFGEHLDWNAITEDVKALMERIREDKEGKDVIGAAQIALYLLVRTCEEYANDHLYKEPYSEQWAQRWAPLSDCMKECVTIVRELLVDGEYIDDDSQRGIIGEMTERIKILKNCSLINMEWVLEEIQEKVLSPRRYISYLNNKFKNSQSFDRGMYFGKKLSFLNKIGKRKEALVAIDEVIIGDRESVCRVPTIDLLMAWGEYEKALELIRSTKEFDCYVSSGYRAEKLIEVLSRIDDKARAIAILKEEFVEASRKQAYYNQLREWMDDKDWCDFIDNALAHAESVFEHDYDEIETQIYIERKQYDQLIAVCNRHHFYDTRYLTQYGKYMPLEDQIAYARHIGDRIKEMPQKMNRRKDYAHVVEYLQSLKDSCEGGRIVAKEVTEYLFEQYCNRPALMQLLLQMSDE